LLLLEQLARAFETIEELELLEFGLREFPPQRSLVGVRLGVSPRDRASRREIRERTIADEQRPGSAPNDIVPRTLNNFLAGLTRIASPPPPLTQRDRDGQ
jgi:hypothetical protein